jgi:hypothetical protein
MMPVGLIRLCDFVRLGTLIACRDDPPESPVLPMYYFEAGRQATAQAA